MKLSPQKQTNTQNSGHPHQRLQGGQPIPAKLCANQAPRGPSRATAPRQTEVRRRHTRGGDAAGHHRVSHLQWDSMLATLCLQLMPFFVFVEIVLKMEMGSKLLLVLMLFQMKLHRCRQVEKGE